MRRFFFIVVLLCALASCDTTDNGTTQSTLTPTEDLPISEIVQTNAAASGTLSSAPTRTPAVFEPRPEPTLACTEAPRTRLILGERGQVSNNDPEPLNVRSGPGTGFNILGILVTSEVFTVLDGPRCNGEYAWYLVISEELQGWIAEGDPNLYYVEPYLPG